MAECLYHFDVDDGSPEITYFPFVNLEPSSNLSASWQFLYSVSGAATAPGQVGVGSSYHYTSLDGASLMISWNGTGINLMGSVSNALYNISLDGLPSAYFADPANSVLASFNNLQNTNHSLLLTTIITNSTSPNAFLTLDKATITYAPPAKFHNTTATSRVIADSDIAFMGQWSFVTDTAGNSLHISNSAGDRTEATFSGSAITIYGLISSYSGNFTVSLDNITTNLSALSSYNNSNSLLFYATDLSQDMLHNIAVINQENSTLALRASGINITFFGNETTSPTSSSNTSSLPAGTIAAIVLAVVLFLVIAIFCYVSIRWRASIRPTLRGPRKSSDEKRDIEQVTNGSPRSAEELESTSLSTTKGYGFGLGLRRGPLLASLKNKIASSSSVKSRNGAVSQSQSHLMASPRDRDEKRLSIFTLAEDLVDAPESEKLAPGWSYSIARPLVKYNSWKETQDLSIPELRVDAVVSADDEDADVKTLTSRQDEALAATLLLSPRTSEAVPAIHGAVVSRLQNDPQDSTGHSNENRQPEFLQVRDTSPFRIDVSAIFGTRKGSRSSKRSSGSGNSTWSKVRSKLYRRTHRDDGGQNGHTDRQESSNSSGPESVPVVLHESHPPSGTAPGSGTYSFLDLTPSRVSLRRHSKTTTLSSTPAELDHGTREAPGWSENTSIRMVRIERSRDTLAPKPDAPSTASGGSPSDNSANSANLASPTVPTPHTQTSSHFPFPITIPPSPHIAPPPEHVPERRVTPSPLRTPPSQQVEHLQIPRVAPRELAFAFANSPTESVPFSVSDIHFRHSFSDYATPDSRRASASSLLPPHPPLPHLEGSQASTPTFSPPPPYIVQRVLGLPVSPLSPLSPILPSALSRTQTLDSSSHTLGAGRPGTASPDPSLSRVSSLLGPRPRPSTAGSLRGSAAPQLPMQGGRSNLRGSPRT